MALVFSDTEGVLHVIGVGPNFHLFNVSGMNRVEVNGRYYDVGMELRFMPMGHAIGHYSQMAAGMHIAAQAK